MLQKIDPLLNGDLLKILCDMGHGDEIILADAHFPAMSQNVPVIRYDGISTHRLLQAILPHFPLDQYVTHAAYYMQMVEDPERLPEICHTYQKTLTQYDYYTDLCPLERFDFYERAKKAYAIIATGETAQYANLILKKGVVMPS